MGMYGQLPGNRRLPVIAHCRLIGLVDRSGGSDRDATSID